MSYLDERGMGGVLTYEDHMQKLDAATKKSVENERNRLINEFNKLRQLGPTREDEIYNAALDACIEQVRSNSNYAAD